MTPEDRQSRGCTIILFVFSGLGALVLMLAELLK